MKPSRRAVIDVGTNSVKLLIAEVEGGEVRPLFEESRQTRLGEGFYQTHQLQGGPIAKTVAAVTGFAAKAREQGATSIRIIATSAARDAVNARELTAALESASGLTVEIISGAQEADWAFEGVATDPRLAAEPMLLLDVGGGSTEFILGQGSQRHFRESYPLGTVRLLERFPPHDPPAASDLAACQQWIAAFLQEKVQPSLAPALERERARPHHQVQLVGVGGSATILGSIESSLRTFNRGRIEATRLAADRLIWQAQRLWSLPLEERKKIPGLPANRADVILAGAAIYAAVAEHFHFPSLRLSTRGLRFAAIRE
jgi:exopolyphosphatase/guanosine-5'-triphosphate,3'-diphosphate pyrophosphatase